jgi:hypothetical protein
MYSTVLHTTWRFNGAHPRRLRSAACCAALSGPGERGGSLQQRSHAKPQMCAECGWAEVSIQRRTVSFHHAALSPYRCHGRAEVAEACGSLKRCGCDLLRREGSGSAPATAKNILARRAREAHTVVRPAICQLSEEVRATLRDANPHRDCYAPKLEFAARVQARDSALVHIGRAECPRPAAGSLEPHGLRACSW